MAARVPLNLAFDDRSPAASPRGASVSVPAPDADIYLALDDRGQLDRLRSLVARWTPESSDKLSRAIAARPGLVSDLERFCSPAIKHPLSDRLGARQHGDGLLLERFFLEGAAAQATRADLATAGRPDLVATIGLAARRLGLPERFRDEPVGSLPDRDGNRVSYCASSEVRHGLAVGERLIQSQGADDVLKSVLIYALICQVHPFMDGNGRLARTLCSMYLAGLGSEPVPLLIGPLMKFSKGGLLIALRELHFFGNAGSLFRYFSIIAGIQQTLIGT